MSVTVSDICIDNNEIEVFPSTEYLELMYYSIGLSEAMEFTIPSEYTDY